MTGHPAAALIDGLNDLYYDPNAVLKTKHHRMNFWIPVARGPAGFTIDMGETVLMELVYLRNLGTEQNR